MVSKINPENCSFKAFSSSNTIGNLKHQLPLLIIGAIIGCIFRELISKLLKSGINERQKRKDDFQKRYEDMHSTTLIMRERKKTEKVIAQQFTIERQEKEINDLKAEKNGLSIKIDKLRTRIPKQKKLKRTFQLQYRKNI